MNNTALLIIDAQVNMFDEQMPIYNGVRLRQTLFASDSFHETNLHETLQTNGIKNLIMAGMQTEFCINATYQRAVELGYEVTAVADAHSTFDMAELTAAQIIEQYNKKFSALAAVKSSQEIIFS